MYTCAGLAIDKFLDYIALSIANLLHLSDGRQTVVTRDDLV